jgi:hypothetical protein
VRRTEAATPRARGLLFEVFEQSWFEASSDKGRLSYRSGLPITGRAWLVRLTPAKGPRHSLTLAGREEAPGTSFRCSRHGERGGGLYRVRGPTVGWARLNTESRTSHPVKPRSSVVAGV